jgi:hypothetical protein
MWLWNVDNYDPNKKNIGFIYLTSNKKVDLAVRVNQAPNKQFSNIQYFLFGSELSTFLSIELCGGI